MSEPTGGGQVRSAERNIPDALIPRINAILGAFSVAEPALGLNEVARRTGLAKSTASRITNELVEAGLLERTDGRLSLGIRLFELGELAARPKDLRRLALATMSDLRQATGQTIHLAVLEGTEVVYVEILQSRTAPALPSRVGGRMPAHATGVGKALLAFSEASVVEEFITRGLAKVGPRTITDPEAFRFELQRIRQSGISHDYEEAGVGLSCAAVPILSPAGQPLAALSISGWSHELKINEVGPAVQASVMALNRHLKTSMRWMKDF